MGYCNRYDNWWESISSAHNVSNLTKFESNKTKHTHDNTPKKLILVSSGEWLVRKDSRGFRYTYCWWLQQSTNGNDKVCITNICFPRTKKVFMYVPKNMCKGRRGQNRIRVTKNQVTSDFWWWKRKRNQNYFQRSIRSKKEKFLSQAPNKK